MLSDYYKGTMMSSLLKSSSRTSRTSKSHFLPCIVTLASLSPKFQYHHFLCLFRVLRQICHLQHSSLVLHDDDGLDVRGGGERQRNMNMCILSLNPEFLGLASLTQRYSQGTYPCQQRQLIFHSFLLPHFSYTR